MVVESARGGEPIEPPEVLQHLLPLHRPAAAIEEIAQDVQLDGCELDHRLVNAGRGESLQIHTYSVKIHRAVQWTGGRTAERGLDASHELGNRERLDHVVVRPE